VFRLGDLVPFTVLFAAGLWRRKQPEAHKRLMTLATIGGFMSAAVAQLVGHQFSLPRCTIGFEADGSIPLRCGAG
jgi:hypothetical protein